MRTQLRALAVLALFSTLSTHAFALDATSDLARARDALTSAQNAVEKAQTDLASRSGEANAIRSDLDEAKRDAELLGPLVRDAERSARATLEAAARTEADRQSIHDRAAGALADAQEAVRVASLDVAKQVAQEKAIIVTRDEFKKARAAADDAERAKERARQAALRAADADPAIAPLKQKSEELEARVKQLREDNAPELPKVSKQWIEAKGQYESARIARLNADAPFKHAVETERAARQAFRDVEKQLNDDVERAEDVVAARAKLAAQTNTRDDAARDFESAAKALGAARAERATAQATLDVWASMPKRLTDRISASQDKLAALSSAIDRLKRDVEWAEADVQRAKSAIADAERAVQEANRAK